MGMILRLLWSFLCCRTKHLYVAHFLLTEAPLMFFLSFCNWYNYFIWLWKMKTQALQYAYPTVFSLFLLWHECSNLRKRKENNLHARGENHILKNPHLVYLSHKMNMQFQVWSTDRKSYGPCTCSICTLWTNAYSETKR